MFDEYPLLQLALHAYVAWRFLCFLGRVGAVHKRPPKLAAEADAKGGGLGAVVGLESVKEEIEQYVEMLRNSDKYTRWGASLPKGVLLVGPPGTGKTLLVKSIAQSVDIPVECASGAEFVEMYVGLGAARVRKLFDRARKHGKCIVFIDEIDGVGAKRGSLHNSERDTTLNQLLVEMDGFGAEGRGEVIVFGATNVLKGLDPALTRSGRFDKKIFFDLPNVGERQEMWKLHMGSVNVPRAVSLPKLAERSAGLSGADIKNACNAAVTEALRHSEVPRLTTESLEAAIDEVAIGRVKPERTLKPDERERVAYHEAGHALMSCMLKEASPPLQVSIIPRGEAALGFSQEQADDAKLHTRGRVLAHIGVLLGGRGGEMLRFGDVSTGAADDIERASALAWNYVSAWGMCDEQGPFNPSSLPGRQGGAGSAGGDGRVKSLLKDIESSVGKLLRKHKTHHAALARHLLKTETLSAQTVSAIVPSRAWDVLDGADLLVIQS